MNIYLDCIQYARFAPTGLILSGYIGNMGRISACSQGATSLTVPATTVLLSQYDFLYLFDGPKTEVLQVGTAGAIIGSTSIPLQSPTAFAHNAGSAYCTDGTDGSLGQQIVTASAWVEDICHQALWNTVYTGEALSLPTMRANLDNQGGLAFRPLHYPVTALSTLTIQTGDSTTAVSYDATQATIDGLKRIVNVPVLKPLSSGQQNQVSQFSRSLTRSTKAVLTITYTAGWVTLPPTVMRACSLLTNQCFVTLSNPLGSDIQQEGKRNITFTMRGDTTGESLLVKEAIGLLQLYIWREA